MPSVGDVLAQCVALIDGGVDPDPGHLSRRHRSAGVAVDVAGDVACVVIVRRGVAGYHWDHHILSRADGPWRWLGGGGGTQPDDGLDERPPAEQLGAPLVLTGGGSGGLDGGDGPWPWSGRRISAADLRASREVQTVRIAGRLVRVARHGYLVAVWASRRPPRVTAFRADGRRLATVRPGRPPRAGKGRGLRPVCRVAGQVVGDDDATGMTR